MNSYFNTLSAERKFPPKRSCPTKKKTQEPPKKLDKAFTRQLAKTLATSNKKKALKKKKTKGHPAKMPKRAAAESYDSDGGFVEDDAPPKSKKSKMKKDRSGGLPLKEKDVDGSGVYWEISGKRRLQLSEFKGNTMVGVREYYEKDGKALPGKKGISMTLDQFNTVVELLPQLEAELKKSGGKLSRPKYDDGAAAIEEKSGGEEEEGEALDDKENDDDEEEKLASKKTKSKLDMFKHKSKNHEATSDEDGQ